MEVINRNGERVDTDEGINLEIVVGTAKCFTVFDR